MAKVATALMLGKSLAEQGLVDRRIPHYGVKEAVFPFSMLPEVDPLLGPEMRSTGEVLGMSEGFGIAFYKAQEGAKQRLPLEGTVLISVADREKAQVVPVAEEFRKLGFRILATAGTRDFLAERGVPAEPIAKLHEGRPHIIDLIVNRDIHLIVNTPAGKSSEYDDSYIRKSAIKYGVPYITTMAAALAAAKGISERRQGGLSVRSLQEYHRQIR
jgi:carbamoyl-phosphate synthase large subunit